VAAVVVVADAKVLPPALDVVVAAVERAHACCSPIQRRCGLQLRLSPLALVVLVVLRLLGSTPTATLAPLAPTPRLVDRCVPVVAELAAAATPSTPTVATPATGWLQRLLAVQVVPLSHLLAQVAMALPVPLARSVATQPLAPVAVVAAVGLTLPTCSTPVVPVVVPHC